MRKSIYIPGFAHTNPVPAACRKGPLVIAGGISGQDPETGQLPATADEQCSNIFKHFHAIMAAGGGTVADIVKVNVWLEHPADRSVLNREWLLMFPDPEDRPTRHVHAGMGLKNVLLVCDLMAVVES